METDTAAAQDETVARRAYVDYVREMQVSHDTPMNYQRFLVEYGFDQDEPVPTCSICAANGVEHIPEGEE